MAKYHQPSHRGHPLPVANTSTPGPIIPARFLKATDKQGMGNNLFADWRNLPDGSP